MKKSMISVLSVILFFFLGISVTTAAEIDGRFFPDEFKRDRTSLQITGVALFRYWGFKAYTGAFYLEKGLPVENILEDKAKRLELEYYRSIKGEDFGNAVNKILAKNLDAERLQALKPKIEYHNSLYKDVEPGDRYSLTYLPGKGTELAFNGEPVEVISGADFAAAIFSIWLGENPISDDFKQTILGNTR